MDIWRWIRNQADRSIAVAAALGGLLAIYLGWRGVSGHLLPSQQIAYLASGAVLGIFLLGVGATLWLSADMKDEWRKLDALATALDRANDIADRAGAEIEAGGLEGLSR